jgi:protein disulfide-isomerase A6
LASLEGAQHAELIVIGIASLFRLASILKKRSLAPSKLDEIKIKANILQAFVEKKVEEAKEKVTRKATAEL